jgi:glycosyltransferase involved in cell wall biosynthesis
MRVANIIEEGKVGGPQIRMVRVAAAMTGAETLIVMPNTNSGAFQALCDKAGVRWQAMPMTRITKEWRVALGYVLFTPFEIARLVRLLRREKIDLVHASGGAWQYKGVIAARLAGVPSVWHLNDTQMPGFLRRLFRLFSPLPAGFIFASHRSRDYYGSLLSDRLQDVIPSTVDTAHFDPALVYPGDEALLAGIGAAPVIGTIANVGRIKGLEILIRAAAVLRRDMPDLRVVIVGPVHANQAAYHAKLVALADGLGVASAIEWVGARADVRPLLARMDVYVCSSLAESSPVSVWEAMAMARPVVSTDVGDVSRHLIDGTSGVIVPVGDHAALAARLADLLADPDRRQAFGAVARAAVVDTFAPHRIGAQTVALYRRALAAKAHQVDGKSKEE